MTIDKVDNEWECALKKYTDSKDEVVSQYETTLLFELFESGRKAGVPKWTSLSDIPAEWKSQNGPNEGYVDILNSDGNIFPNAVCVQLFNMVGSGYGRKYDGTSRCYWQSASGHEINEPTHGALALHMTLPQ